MTTNKKYGLQLFSIHQSVKDDFPGTMKMLKEMGYDGIEFAGAYGREQNRAKEIVLDAGLTPISAHIGLDQFDDGIEKKLDFIESLGVKHVVVPVMNEKYRSGVGEDFNYFVNRMIEISRAAKERGISLGYHNHNFEFETKIGDKNLFDHLFDAFGKGNVNAQIDLGWLGIAKEDPVAYIKKYKGAVPLLHLKDVYLPHINALDPDPDEVDYVDFRPMGMGSLNVPEIIKTAEECGNEWLIVEQDDKSYRFPELTRLQSLKMSIDYLHAL